MPRTADDYTTLRDELTASVDRLRTELRGCLDAVLPSLDGARACGRALGLKRQLGWRAYTVATSTDLPSVLEGLPRRQGWKMIVASLRSLRCPEERLKPLSETIDAVLGPIESGRLSRSMVRSLAAGRLDAPRDTVAMLEARRSTREGSEQMYGIRCRAQLGAYLIGPADREGWVDIVTIMEYDALQRLRPGPPFMVKAVAQMWHTEWKGSRASDPLGANPERGGLVAELSTPDVWRKHLRLRSEGSTPIIRFEAGTRIPAPPVRLVFAEHIARGGTVGQKEDLVDLLLGVMLPARQCVFEAWIHRSHRLLADPVAALQGSFRPVGSFGDLIDLAPLPLEAEAREVASPALPGTLRPFSRTHTEALGRATTALGSELADFTGFRVIVPDPPIGSRVHLRWRM